MSDDYTELIARLKKFRGMWMGDGIHPSIERQALIDALQAQAREIERLTACLKTANSNHEHFEREWHLRGDELEALRADVERYRWLRRRTPGSEYRIMGVVYSEGGSGVDAAIDAAMQAGKAVTQ